MIKIILLFSYLLFISNNNAQFFAPYTNVSFGDNLTTSPVDPLSPYPERFFYNAYNRNLSLQLSASGGSSLYPIDVAILYKVTPLVDKSFDKVTTNSAQIKVWHFCPDHLFNYYLIYVIARKQSASQPNTTIDFSLIQRNTQININNGLTLSGSNCGNSPGPYFEFTMTNAANGPIRIFVYHENGDTTNIGYRVQTKCSTQSSGFTDFAATTTDSVNEIASNQLLTNTLYYIEMRQSGSTGDCSIASSWSQYKIGICQGVNCNINNPITTVSTTTTTTTLNSITQPILPSDNGNTTTSATTNNASSKTILSFGTQFDSIFILFLFLEIILYTLY